MGLLSCIKPRLILTSPSQILLITRLSFFDKNLGEQGLAYLWQIFLIFWKVMNIDALPVKNVNYLYGRLINLHI